MNLTTNSLTSRRPAKTFAPHNRALPPRCTPPPSISLKLFRLRAATILAMGKATRGAATAAASTGGPIMDVTRSNFQQAIPEVEKALAGCDFYSFDGEFTGLFDEGPAEEFLDTLDERYTKLARCVSKFCLTQFGLAAFTWRDDVGKYEAKTFNFYAFPKPFGDSYERRFLSSAAAIQFLADNNFDFNKQIREGVPFMPASMRDQMIREGGKVKDRREMQLNDPQAKQFAEDVRARALAWLTGSSDATLDLPPSNPWFRAVTYQELSKLPPTADGPGFYTEKVEGGYNATYIRLVRASSAEIAAHEEEEERRRVEAIQAASGLAKIAEVMAASGKPAVGHNCLFDLLYVIDSFVRPLSDKEAPAGWAQFGELVLSQAFTGGVYDTKLLARRLPGVFTGGTSLAEVFTRVAEGATRLDVERSLGVGFPVVEHAEGFDRYRGVEGGSYAHEAGYDAFMTGATFASVLRLLDAASRDPAFGEKIRSYPTQDAVQEAAAAAATAAAGEGPKDGEEGEAGRDGLALSAMSIDDDVSASFVIQREERPSLEAASNMINRINVLKSDYAFAALDPAVQEYPDRAHILVLTGMPATTKVGELYAALRATAGLPRVRASAPPSGAPGTFIVEVMQDRDAAKDPPPSPSSPEQVQRVRTALDTSDLVRAARASASAAALPLPQILSLDRWKAEVAAGGVGNGADTGAADGERPAKRVRRGVAAAAVAAPEPEPAPAASRCSIM